MTERDDLCHELTAPKFLEAALRGDLAFILEWIAQHQDLNAVNSRGYSALLIAVEAQHLDCAQLLLQEGCSLRSEEGVSALEVAAFTLNPTMLSYLARLPQTWQEEELALAAIHSIKKNHAPSLQAILPGILSMIASPEWDIGYALSETQGRHGTRDTLDALIDQVWFRPHIALIAAAQSGHTDMVKALSLLPHEIPPHRYALAFLHSVEKGHRESTEILLQKNQSLHHHSPQGWMRCVVQALGLAAENGHVDILTDLLHDGEHSNLTQVWAPIPPHEEPYIDDPHTEEPELFKPLRKHWIFTQHSGMNALMRAALADQLACLHILLNHSQAFERDLSHRDALMYAAMGASFECSQALIGRCSGHVFDVDGLDALMHASKHTDLKLLQLLLPWSNPQRTDHSGATALMWASKESHVECVKYLLPFSDPQAVSIKGRTALIAAAWRGRHNNALLLLPVSNPFQSDDEGITASQAAAIFEKQELKPPSLSRILAQWEQSALDRHLLENQLLDTPSPPIRLRTKPSSL